LGDNNLNLQRGVVKVRPHVILEHGYDAVQDIKSFYLADPELKLVKTLRLTFTRKKAEEFYAQHKGKFFFENLMKTTTEDESALLLFEGPNAIEKIRKITGPTDSRKAPKGTVREKYGIKAPPGVKDPGSKNGVHASDSVESATREERIGWVNIKGLE